MRRERQRKEKMCTLYYVNINGFRSNVDSLNDIVKKLNPSIIALCETKIDSSNIILKRLSKSFNVITRQTKEGQSGLMIAVRKDSFASMLGVASTVNKNIMVARLNSDGYNIRVILVYAPQETERIDAREEFFTELEIEVAKCMVDDDHPIIVGDFNARLEFLNNTVVSKSENGGLLLNIIEENKLSVLNFSDKCTGKWTHVIRTREKKSDHNAMILTMKISNEKQEITKDEFSGRKLTPERIEKYKEQMNTRCCKYNRKVTYKAFEKDIRQVMGKCFLKPKPKASGRDMKHSSTYFKFVKKINLFAKCGKIQRTVAKVYRDVLLKSQAKTVATNRNERIRKTVKMLIKNGKFTLEIFWKLRKSLSKRAEVCTSIITSNGNEVFGDDCVRNAYRNEFQQRLEMEEGSSDMKEYQRS